jgi:hypothetical protein
MLYCTSFSSQGLVLMSCCSAAPQDTCVSPSHARARCFVCLLFVFDRLLLGTNFFEHVSTWQRGKMEKVVPSDCAGKVDAAHSLPEHGDGARVGASGEEVALTSAECELVLGVCVIATRSCRLIMPSAEPGVVASLRRSSWSPR